MREILQPMQEWFDDGKEVALATVVEIYGSAPRGLGAKMAVNQDSLMAGSVSGAVWKARWCGSVKSDQEW